MGRNATVEGCHLTVKDKLVGQGAFATKALERGEVLTSFDARYSERASKYTIQVGVDMHLDTTGTPGAFINHSCAPNSRFVVPALHFVATRAIQVGDEVTFNYLSSEWDMASPFECTCAVATCLGYIRGFRYLDSAHRRQLDDLLLPYLCQMNDPDVTSSKDVANEFTEAPPWPLDSVAHLSDRQCWDSARARELAGQVADFLPSSANANGPLADEHGVGQRWLTSGLKAARSAATEAFERARRELALNSCNASAGLERSLQELLRCADGRGTIDSHGGYMAYAPTAALFEGALAAFGCAVVNPGLTWMPTSPEYAAIERCVIDWVAADVLHWPSSNGGVFTSGGSVANTLGLHVARDAIVRNTGVRPADVMFFLPEHAHYCLAKGMRVLGVDPAQIIRIPCGSDGRVGIDMAIKAVADAAARAKHSFAGVVIGVGGETSTGYVDSLSELADLCASRGNLWLHVDACFGGFFGLTERGAALLHGIDRADSVALDPHKALQAPYGVGLLMVRSERDLRLAFAMSAAYTPPSAVGDDSEDIADIADLGLELTREARGAQVWLPLRAYGPRAFAKHLDWCQDAVRWLASTILAATDHLEVVTQPQLSTLTLRLRGNFSSITQTELSAWLVDEVNAKGRTLIAPTTIATHGSCVRICVLSARSRPEHLQQLAADLVAAAGVISKCAHRLELARRNPLRTLGFRVPYSVRPLPGKGLSVVASEDISAGSLVWEFEEGSCLPTTADDVQRFAREKGREATGDFLNHCFCWGGEMLYPQGDTQFLNHAKSPNIATVDQSRWLALRFIAAGEELLDDYGTYENLEVYERLCAEFGVDSSSRVAALFNV